MAFTKILKFIAVCLSCVGLVTLVVLLLGG